MKKTKTDEMVLDTALAKADSIGMSKVDMQNKRREFIMFAKTDKDFKDQLHEYVFGSGENPLEQIQNDINKRTEGYDAKIDVLVDDVIRTRNALQNR